MHTFLSTSIKYLINAHHYGTELSYSQDMLFIKGFKRPETFFSPLKRIDQLFFTEAISSVFSLEHFQLL